MILSHHFQAPTTGIPAAPGTLVVGADPGTGAGRVVWMKCWLIEKETGKIIWDVRVNHVPVAEDKRVAFHLLRDLFPSLVPDAMGIERVYQGTKLLESAGALRASFCTEFQETSASVYEAPGATWQKFFGLHKMETTAAQRKARSLRWLYENHPALAECCRKIGKKGLLKTMDHNVADAILIALWALAQEQEVEGDWLTWIPGEEEP